MKILLTLLCTLIFASSSGDQKSPEPIMNFLKLMWEVEVITPSTLPAINDHYLFTPDNIVINVRTGKKIALPDLENHTDSLLIHSTDSQIKVTDIKNNLVLLEKRRSRPYYIGPKQVQLVNDSIWVEITNKTLIQGVNLRTKEILWATQSTSRIFNKPIIVGDEVYIPNLNQLLILNKHSGNVISSLSLEGPVLSGIKKYKNILYMIVENEGLIAFDHVTKTIKWRVKLNRYSSRANQIIVEGDRVYFSDNSLHAVSQVDGSTIWDINEKDGVYIVDSRLSIVKNYIIFYLLQENETLLTVANKDTGKILYQGLNSSVLGGDSNNSDGVAKEDLLLIDFVDEVFDNNILVGVLDNKIYGLEILK